MCHNQEEVIEAIVNHDILIWARENRGFSIEHSAKEIGVSPEMLTQWENGGKLTIKDLRKIAEVYEISMMVFFLNERPDPDLYDDNPDIYAEFEDSLERVRKNIIEQIDINYGRIQVTDDRLNKTFSKILDVIKLVVNTEINEAIENLYTEVEEG
jgi:transcriptional regulator with XRE-family HTH domain